MSYSSAGTFITGVLLPWSGRYEDIPVNWLPCDGASLLRSEYPELFNVIGTKFGTADGEHFNVPDLRGLFLRGHDNSAGNDGDSGSRTTLCTGGCTGDNVGSYQADGFRCHTHSVNYAQRNIQNDANSDEYIPTTNFGNENYGQQDTLPAGNLSTSESRPANKCTIWLVKGK